MVRPTDQEAIAIGKIVFYSQFPRGGAQTPHGPHDETPELVRRQRGWGQSVGKSIYCGWMKQDKKT